MSRMGRFDWFAARVGARRPARKRSPTDRPENRALRFESLEDRRMLAVITVDSLEDNLTVDGQVTLREAIQAANTDTSVDGSVAGSGADTIEFDASLAGGTISLELGELQITESLTLDASALTDRVTVTAQGLSSIVNFTPSSGDLTVEGLNLHGGKAPGYLNGGGINFQSAGALAVIDSTISGSSSNGNGGGIYAVGDVTLTGSVIDSTFAGQNGGGIYSLGNVTLQGSSITGSVANGSGGGAWMQGSLVLMNSTISGNTAGLDGGGIHSQGSVTLNQSSVLTNLANRDGGGISANGTVTLIESSVSENYIDETAATSHGAGIQTDGNVLLYQSTVSGNYINNGTGAITAFGGGIWSNGNVLLTRSTLDSNGVRRGQGGGIWATGQVNLTNSTVSGNSAGISQGGGIWTAGGATLTHSTVTQNVADGTNGVAGGIWNSGSGAIVIEGSILSGNFRGSGSSAVVDDLGPGSGSVTANFSLLGNAISPNSGGNNIVTNDPQLNPLAFNGGATRTHSLSLGHPAIDAGDPTIQFSATEFDQRGDGFFRVVDGDAVGGARIDIGAYELQYSSIPPLIVDSLSDVVDGDFGPGDLSLREAVAFANSNPGADTITFDVSVAGGTISLMQGEIQISDSLTIDATAAGGGIVIDAGHGVDGIPVTADGYRIFRIDDGDSSNVLQVLINLLTLTGGDVSTDGGAIASFEELTITNSRIVNNSTQRRGGGIAMVSFARLISSNNEVADNASADRGGGMFVQGELALSETTVSGNTANRYGGGIHHDSGADIDITQSTIVGNTSNRTGGGVYTKSSNLTVLNSMIAGNVATFGNSNLEFQGLVTTDYSLIGDTAGTNINGSTGTGNLLNVDPLLGPLADNGGLTRTHALLPGSPAIDAGDPAIAHNLSEYDQRGAGFIRVLDGDQVGGARIDIGAFELQTVDVAPPVVTVDALTTSDTTPQLTGTIDDETATITVDVGGQTGLVAANNGDGTWTLPDDTISTPLAGGVYDVVVMATDWTGNVGTDATSDELTILAPGTYIVDTLTDEDDGDFSAGDFSLREAIGLANADSGSAETILFDAALDGGTILLDLALGEMPISDALTIDATSLSVGITLDARHGTDGVFGTWDGIRIFHIDDFNAGLLDVHINGVTLTGGDVSGTGGAIRSAERLSLAHSTIVSNSASGSAPVEKGGGGIDATELHLYQTEIIGNNSGGRGGGINADLAFIVESNIVGNSSSLSFTRGGGGIFAHSLMIQDSTVSGNTLTGNGVVGAGIYGSAVAIDNSTISGNQATGGFVGGGSGPPRGGGVYARESLILANSTVTDNHVGDAAGTGGGVGVYNSTSVILQIENSIIAGNTTGGSSPDLMPNSGSTNINYSLVGDTSGSGITGTSGNGNLLDVDPLLDVLADNGGPTLTHALLPGSPAIDAGDPSFMPPPDYDQRGAPFVRVFDGDGLGGAQLDIGALEVQADITPPTVAFVRVGENPTTASEVVFDVTFSEAVSGVDATDFALALTGSLTANGTVVVDDAGDADPTTYTVTIDTIVGEGTLGLDIAGSTDIEDLASNPLDVTPTVNELFTVDNIAPTVTVNALQTIDATPALTGTVDDPTAVVTIEVGGQTDLVAVNHGNGTWSLPDNTISPALAPGVYDVMATAEDAAGNSGIDNTTDELTITVPAPTLLSFTRQNPLTNPTDADVLVFRASFDQEVMNIDTSDFVVNGTTTAMVSSLTPIAGDTYDITVSGGDLASLNGVVGIDLASGQDIQDLGGNPLPAGEPAIDETYTLVNDVIAPTVAITRVAANPTNASSVAFNILFSEEVQDVDPTDFVLALTGSASGNSSVVLDDAGDTNPTTFRVTVDTVSGDGTLGLDIAGSTDIKDLAANTLDLTPTIAEAYTIDNTAPIVTVDFLLTIDSTPELSGMVDDPSATVTVAVAGQTGLLATNNGDGTWTLADNTISPALIDGTYDILVTATDLAANASIDPTVEELVIDSTLLRGDMNGDLVINHFDIPLFMQSLLDRSSYDAAYPQMNADVFGDVNIDGMFDFGDLGPFNALFASVGANLYVTNTNASGPGSLRQAVAESNATSGITETIVFDLLSSTALIIDDTGPLQISDSVIFNVSSGDVVQTDSMFAWTIDAGTSVRQTGGGDLEVRQAFDNSGSVEVLLGSLNLAGGGASGGDFLGRSNTTLTLSTGHALDANSSISSAGEVHFAGSVGPGTNITIDGIYSVLEATRAFGLDVRFTASVDDVGRELEVQGALLRFDGGGIFSVEDATIENGGILSGSMDITVTNQMVVSNPSVAGKIVASSGVGQITVEPTGTAYFRGNTTIENGFTLSLNGDTQTSGATVIALRESTINNTGTFTVLHDFDVLQDAGVETSTFNNAGTYIVNVGVGEISRSRNVNFNHTGTIELHQGVLELGSGGNSSGSITTLPGTTLSISGNHTFGGSSSLFAAGDVRFANLSVDGTTPLGGGATSINGSYEVTATGTTSSQGVLAIFSQPITQVGTGLYGGAFSFAGGGSITVQELTLGTFGQLFGPVDIVVTDQLSFDRVNLSGSPGPATLTVAATANADLTGNSNVENDFTVNFLGTVSTSGAGQIDVRNATINNVGTFNVLHDFDFVNNGGLGSVAIVNNSGTFVVDVDPADSISFSPNTIGFTNTGLVDVLSGTLDFAHYVQTAGETRIRGGAITSSQILDFQGGILTGTDSVSAVLNAGDVQPGSDLGTLQVVGAYQQTSGGLLSIELAAGAQDKLQVHGAVSLGGQLDVTLVGGYTPTLNDQFTIIDNDATDAVSGNFAGLPDGATFVVDSTGFQISYSAGTDNNDVVLLVVNTGLVQAASGGTVLDQRTLAFVSDTPYRFATRSKATDRRGSPQDLALEELHLSADHPGLLSYFERAAREAVTPEALTLAQPDLSETDGEIRRASHNHWDDALLDDQGIDLVFELLGST